MLSRSAQGLYWMGRYLERADYLCRLLQLQVEALVDRPVAEIHFGWSRIYAVLDRQPPFGDDFEDDESDDFLLADSYTLAGDLTFERANLESIRNCFALGRENARQMRHCISAEMWSCLNLAWLRIRDLDIEDIWKVSPESFYAPDEPGHRHLRRSGRSDHVPRRGLALHAVRTLHRARPAPGVPAPRPARHRAGAGRGARIGLDEPAARLPGVRRLQARLQRRGPARAGAGLLVADRLLPGSLHRSLETLASELGAIGPSPNARAGAAAERLAGRLCALVRYEWPDHHDRPALLSRARDHCFRLHELVNAAYVDYDLEDAPIR